MNCHIKKSCCRDKDLPHFIIIFTVEVPHYADVCCIHDFKALAKHLLLRLKVVASSKVIDCGFGYYKSTQLLSGDYFMYYLVTFILKPNIVQKKNGK